MSESERPEDPSVGEPSSAGQERALGEEVVEAEPPPAPPPTPSTAARRLVRSRDDRVLAGVCGGLGEYLGVDAILIRIAALVLIFAGGAGLLLYVIGWIAMPEAPSDGTVTTAPTLTSQAEQTTGAIVLGALLVLIGAFFLLDEVFPDFLSWNWIWPIALIAVGAVVILRARR